MDFDRFDVLNLHDDDRMRLARRPHMRDRLHGDVLVVVCHNAGRARSNVVDHLWRMIIRVQQGLRVWLVHDMRRMWMLHIDPGRP